MKRRLEIQPLADRDLDEIADYIAQDNLDASLRFLRAAELTFDFLTEMPFAGVSCSDTFESSRARELRLWRVKGFSNYQILYQVTEARLLIVRGPHAARDVKAIMDSQ